VSEEQEQKAWEEETERLRAEALARQQAETVQEAINGVNNVIEARGLKLLNGIRGWCVVSITPPRRIILKDAPLTAAVEFALRHKLQDEEQEPR
jgi:hypothetical protein